jgi:hypothetical protein
MYVLALSLMLIGEAATPGQRKAVKVWQLQPPDDPALSTYRDSACGVAFQHPAIWVVTASRQADRCVFYLGTHELPLSAHGSGLPPADADLVVETSTRSVADVFSTVGFQPNPDGSWRSVSVQLENPARRVVTKYCSGVHAVQQWHGYTSGGDYTGIAELPAAGVSCTGGIVVAVHALTGGASYHLFELVLASIRSVQ